MAKRVTQVVAEAAYQGSPAKRVTQVVAEAAYSGSPAVRFTQAVVEVAFVPGAAPATGSFHAQVIG